MAILDTGALWDLAPAPHTVWNSGDYAHIARTLEPGALAFFDRLRIRPGERVLDAACGTGQVALPAARAGAFVVGIDFAANWIDEAQRRAAQEELVATFDLGDVEAMPYADGAFDVTVSLLGAMFAAHPSRAACELMRVTRPGGRVVLGNWTRTGFVAEFAATLQRFVPELDLADALDWGDAASVRALFRDRARAIHCECHPYRLSSYMPVEQTVRHFLTAYGPTRTALAHLPSGRRQALTEALEAVFARHNVGREAAVEIDAEVLDVVALRA